MRKSNKQLPVWALIIIDITLTALCFGIFITFDYILPQKNTSIDINLTTINNTSLEKMFDLPNLVEDYGPTTLSQTSSQNTSSSSASSSKSRNSRKSSNINGNKDNSNMSNTGTKKISSDASSISAENKNTTLINTYKDNNTEILINKVELGADSEKITYYAADIYVTNTKYIETAFAEGTYGKNIKETVLDMANENNAIFAISGDFYGNSENGVVIRNGTLYRDNVNDADISVLYSDGTMTNYSGSEFNKDLVESNSPWQAWNFGPSLLDGNGNILSSFNTTSYLNSENPRCAIGTVSAGHYKVVVVDGRNEGYSRGVTLSELASIMKDEGAKSAYNLDGGKSAAMVFNGEYVNQPADGGREVSDIIYVGDDNND